MRQFCGENAGIALHRTWTRLDLCYFALLMQVFYKIRLKNG